MLPSGLDEQFTTFYHAAYAEGEVDAKTKILIGMAVSSAVGCYPWMRYYFGVAKDKGVTEGALREALSIAVAVSGGRVRAQAREAFKGFMEPLPKTQSKESCHG